ncbi:phosphohistidine swiveling domain-containing protein [Streptomyces umbrinus]|uniref:Phosphohistidine swiveling domain-containing protein n=1 Tax=Streptomyces umbrinus TaxID=67370 RepID=A0ABU0T2Y1_9ACTN|nr:PEP/pyruvate-binding domain-containing protein [Streptomyces umbrinus]MDQ1030151.1 phosphohistidine swiveling domain-containing protein [Streptomyces umbrinus]
MTTVDERHGDGARDGDDQGGVPRIRDPLASRFPRTAPEAPRLAPEIPRLTAEAVPLSDPRAARIPFAGSKAAHLARAALAGLPVLPGFVVPYGDWADKRAGEGDLEGLRRAWQKLSADGTRPLVVRSSSPQEDTQESSLAGQFASVLDVQGWHEFRAAVRTVLDSAHRPDGTVAPMAVLVQPMLAARVGGVMFGADPVEGRTDRMLVSAVRGGPDSLVSGEQPGTNYWLSRWGRLLRTEPEDPEGLLGADGLRRLAQLARQARGVFGGPQDIEFGFDASGRLWLFQSRPITAMAARPARGARLLGPGPVAETLPDQLEPLEEDLWVAPMARGLAAALDIGGTAPRRQLRSLPLVRAVGGRAAADLRLLGAVPPRNRWLALLNPAPGARRLAAAWRVGRLTAALPGLAVDLVADVDRRLAETPPADRLTRPDLLSTLRWTRTVLVSLHAQEALAGALLPEPRATAAGTALAALAESRALGVPDDRMVAAQPVVLALVAPGLGRELRLPADPGDTEGAPTTRQGAASTTALTDTLTALDTLPPPLPSLPPREALRLRIRIRWVQELQVRLVREAARRLAVRRGPGEASKVGLLRWREFVEALEHGRLPGDFEERLPRAVSAPLPDAFRLAEGGTVVAERPLGKSKGKGGSEGAGQGVSGGRAAGTAWDGTGTRPADPVLVVRTLDPALAPLLPGLAGLVAQTGSPLSHLAVLAREFGLPTVVGATDAVRRFPPGSRLTVDGTTGDVHVREQEEQQVRAKVPEQEQQERQALGQETRGDLR